MINVTTEAEQALIGCLLLDNQTLDRIGDFLKGEHFSHYLHGKLFESIKDEIQKGNVVDPIIAKEFIKNDMGFSSPYDDNYLVSLTSQVLTTQTADHYSRIIYNNYLKRQLMAFHRESLDRLLLMEESQVTDYLDELDKRFNQLIDTDNKGDALIPLHTPLGQSIEKITDIFFNKRDVLGMSVGLKALDDMLGGLHPSDLIILGGRPSMGKTALATIIALNVAKAFQKGEKGGVPVGFFSLEMSAQQLASRILSIESSIPSNKIRQAAIQKEDLDKFRTILTSFQDLPLFVDETSSLKVSALRSRARKLKKDHNVGLLIIDYLQLLESEKANGNRVQEVSEISRQLKGLAKELNIPIIALSQLSRAVEGRDSKRPQLSDLRDSGSIEQDADVVMFVYREDYYSKKQDQDSDFSGGEKRVNVFPVRAEVIVSKQRHDPIGTCYLGFNSSLTSFENL